MTDKCKTFVARWDHAMCSTCGEEHDRLAPTPTPAPGLDLDAVEAAERKMTPGPWRWGRPGEMPRGMLSLHGAQSHVLAIDVDSAHAMLASDAAGIVALRNAAPALIAEVRALRRHFDAAGPDHNLLALLDLYHDREQSALAEVATLREKLAEAKRLGMESYGRSTHTEQCGKTQADYHHSKGYRGCPGEDEDCTCGLAAIAAALEAL